MERLGLDEGVQKHPLHGATGKGNLSVDYAKDQWKCFRCESGGGPLQWLAVEMGLVECCDCVKPSPVRGDVFRRVMLEGVLRGVVDASEVKGAVERATLVNMMGGWAWLEVNQRMLWYSEERGIWLPAHEIIKRVCKTLWPGMRKAAVGELEYHIEALSHVREDVFEADPRYVACLNGVLDLDTGNLLPHSPDFMLTTAIPVVFDPDPDTTAVDRLEKFLDSIVDGDDRKVLEEWMGYCLWRTYPYHKAMLLLGDGRNGKTTFVTLLTGMLGESNVGGRPSRSWARTSSPPLS
jgi:hypothetical protein